MICFNIVGAWFLFLMCWFFIFTSLFQLISHIEAIISRLSNEEETASSAMIEDDSEDCPRTCAGEFVGDVCRVDLLGSLQAMAAMLTTCVDVYILEILFRIVH